MVDYYGTFYHNPRLQSYAPLGVFAVTVESPPGPDLRFSAGIEDIFGTSRAEGTLSPDAHDPQWIRFIKTYVRRDSLLPHPGVPVLYTGALQEPNLLTGTWQGIGMERNYHGDFFLCLPQHPLFAELERHHLANVAMRQMDTS